MVPVHQVRVSPLDGIVATQSVIRVTNNEIKDFLVPSAIKLTEPGRPKKWRNVLHVPSTFPSNRKYWKN